MPRCSNPLVHLMGLIRPEAELLSQESGVCFVNRMHKFSWTWKVQHNMDAIYAATAANAANACIDHLF